MYVNQVRETVLMMLQEFSNTYIEFDVTIIKLTQIHVDFDMIDLSYITDIYVKYFYLVFGK